MNLYSDEREIIVDVTCDSIVVDIDDDEIIVDLDCHVFVYPAMLYGMAGNILFTG